MASLPQESGAPTASQQIAADLRARSDDIGVILPPKLIESGIALDGGDWERCRSTLHHIFDRRSDPESAVVRASISLARRNGRQP